MVKAEYSTKSCGIKENNENNYSKVIGGSISEQPNRLKFKILNRIALFLNIYQD